VQLLRRNDRIRREPDESSAIVANFQLRKGALFRLIDPTSGTVRFDGSDIVTFDDNAMRPQRRGAAHPAVATMPP
jgi:ABC-type iron transport system FetAB ATPase subunit